VPHTFDSILTDARRRLARTSFEAPRREAALLLGSVLGLTEAQVLARGNEVVPAEARGRFQDLLGRRLQGEPVAYLLGEREFYGRPFFVDPRVLIPRPETEHLVEAVLEEGLGTAPRILDVGTGSGCIAVTLALELPAARLTATDVSFGALAVARANALRHGVAGRVRLLLLDGVRGLDLAAFDLVASNPPYVSPEDEESLSVEVRAFEPRRALFAAAGGLEVLRRLLDGARTLRPEASMAVEIGFGQLGPLRDEAEARGLTIRRVVADYAGIPRTVLLGLSSWGLALGRDAMT
jgi:release factor glutamine methyltransferase